MLLLQRHVGATTYAQLAIIQPLGIQTADQTRSSAVAERPRDASCLSVVSFNSTIRPAKSFIIGYFGSDLPLHTSKCYSVVFGVMLSLLVFNTSLSVSRHQQTPPLIECLTSSCIHSNAVHSSDTNLP